MKKFLFVIAALSVLAACKKNGTPSPKASLFGKWELRRVHGGISPLDSTFAKGNGTAFQFNSDSTYVHFFRGTVNANGVYHIVKKGYQTGSQFYDEVTFDTNISGDPIVLSGTNLTIGTLVADGFEYDYEKISN